MLRSNT